MIQFSKIATPLVLTATILLVSCSTESSSQSAAAEDTNQTTPIPSRSDAPADPNGDYRADSALHVGATGNPQLIEFFAYWCTTCRAMKPTIHGLEAEYWDRIDFVYLDIDDPTNDEIKQSYNYRAQPTFVLVTPNGTEIRQWYGYTAEDELSRAFDEYLDTQ